MKFSSVFCANIDAMTGDNVRSLGPSIRQKGACTFDVLPTCWKKRSCGLQYIQQMGKSALCPHRAIGLFIILTDLSVLE